MPVKSSVIISINCALQGTATEQQVHACRRYVLGWPSMLLEALARQMVHIQGRYTAESYFSFTDNSNGWFSVAAVVGYRCCLPC
jgi:hypothetical protein